MRRKTQFVAAILVMATVVAGCGGSSTTTNGKQGGGAGGDGGPFVVNLAFAPSTLDPHLTQGQIDIGFPTDLYSTLVQYADAPIPDAPDGVEAVREDQTEIVPYLAESYEVTDDGKTLTFKLREGLKFPSGNPIDSAAIKASYERTIELGGNGAYYAKAGGQPDELFKSIETPDPLTFVMKLSRPEALVLKSLAQPPLSIVDVKYIREQGPDTPEEPSKWLATNSAGAGPYQIKEYRPGVRAVLEANPDFFGDPPLEKEVIVNFIPNNSTLSLQATNGSADVTIGLTKKSVQSVESNDCCNVVKVETHTTQLIALPHDEAPFDNKTFREALTYAVPYDDLVEQVAFGYGTRFYGPFAPAMPGYDPEIGTPRDFDMAKAEALIKESGVKLPVEAELIILDSQFDQAQIATIVQNTWSKLGVNLKIRKLPPSVYNSDKGGVFGDNERPLIRWDGASVVDPSWLLDYDMQCEPPSFANTSDYCNREAVALLEKAHLTLDEQERNEYWKEIAKIWVADSPRIPLYAETYTAVLGRDVTQWRYTQNGPMNVARWGR